VVDHVDEKDWGQTGPQLGGLAERACGRRVDVIVVDRPRLESWSEWPSTLESRALQEGIWLTKTPARQGTERREEVSVGQIGAAAVAAALENTATQIHAALRDMHPDPLEVDSINSSEPDVYWNMVWRRLGSINADLHIAVEQSFVVLCHLIGAPYSTPAHSLATLYESLKDWGLADLDVWLDSIDLRWVEQWRSGGSYRPDLARNGHTTTNLAAATAEVSDHAAELVSMLASDVHHYGVAVADISEAVVRIVADRVDRSEVDNTEHLRGSLEEVRWLSGLLRERISDGRWLYPDGEPPLGWDLP